MKVRLLQILALYIPGATTVRVWLHRWRGVSIGNNVFIGTDAIIETARPELVWIGNGVTLSVRTTIVAHFRGRAARANESGTDRFSVRIEDNVYIGPGVIVLPGVNIRQGAVVAAGSVVTSTVGPMLLVQGNPARPVARCGIPLGPHTAANEFYSKLRPLRPHATQAGPHNP